MFHLCHILFAQSCAKFSEYFESTLTRIRRYLYKKMNWITQIYISKYELIRITDHVLFRNLSIDSIKNRGNTDRH